MESMNDLVVPDDDDHDHDDYSYQGDQPIQLIYDILQHVPKGECLENMTPLVTSAVYHMQKVKLRDVDIDPSQITTLTTAKCMSIVESNHFDLALFLLPKGFILHLHDHPNMMVITTLLAGSIHIRSFSRKENLSTNHSDEFYATLEFDQEKTFEDNPWYLTPKHGNYHEITALTNCVMLDILLPPYHDDHRSCTFYSATKQPRLNNTIPGDWIIRPLPQIVQDSIVLPSPMTYTGYNPRQAMSPTTSVESIRGSDDDSQEKSK